MKNNTSFAAEPAPMLYRADLFVAAKERRGFSYAAISEAIGMSINTIKSIVDGNSNSLDRIARLAEFYDLEMIEVFDVAGRIRPIDETIAAAWADDRTPAADVDAIARKAGR